MSHAAQINRRDLLKSSAALVVGFYLPPQVGAMAQSPAPGAEFKPNAWITITPDNRVTLLVERPELGQGPRTVDAMMLADEMEADWSTIQVEQAPTIPEIYKRLSAGGSGGVMDSWVPLRTAGAQVRETLLAAAAQQLNVDKKDCRAENSTVVHVPSGRRMTYGELVETASMLPIARAEGIALKQPADFRFIGKPIQRVDTPAKIDGSAQFGIDVRVPNMLFAVIARCPHFGGKLLTCDDAAAKAVPGVRQVFVVPPIERMPVWGVNIRVAGGVAVVADTTWAAMEGRRALKLTWDKGPGGTESTASIREQMEQQSLAPATYVAASRGNAQQALAGAAKTVEATYDLPFQAHATMEPMNTTMHVRDDGIVVWSPTQIAAELQGEIAALSGVPAARITVHMTYSGGSFGRRYMWDYGAEAWQVAKEVKQPVQLVWTREDDMQHDFYRQYSFHRLSAGLDAKGNLQAWKHRIVSTPIRAVFDSPESLRDPKHVAAQEISSSDSLPYAIPNFQVDYAPVLSVVPRAWWRAVENSYNAFATECFIDEVAHAVGQDPCAFRIKLLEHEPYASARAEAPSDAKADAAAHQEAAKSEAIANNRKFVAVLRLAAEKSDWGKPMPAGQGRGIACYSFAGTAVAIVAEVAVEKDGTVDVLRVVTAIDCGTAVNPDGVRAMAEGGINYALTPVLTGEVTIKDGAVVESNFHDFRVLRMRQAPEIEVHLIPSTEKPTGMGEATVPPLAPAVANAVFAATGKRLRRLPIDPAFLAAKA
jgi:isoquinoline 1-oxidoreductase beta subunit